jgi:OOP family OmpA-OmpF porin
MQLRIIIFLFLFAVNQATAQSNYLKFRTYKPYSWMVGVGWSFVDNDGSPYKGIFNVANWSAMPYPSYVTVDKYFKYGLSLELGLSFNQFNGKLVNGVTSSGIMFASDITCRYSIYEYLYKKVSWFDPYLGVGVGGTYTTASSPQFYPSLNGVVGGNFWMGNFGIRLQGTAKFGIANGFYRTNANYLQYTASVVYKIQPRDKVNRSNDKPRYKWVRKKPGKYKDSRSK